jgi:diaminopimelate decarboxylase
VAGEEEPSLEIYPYIEVDERKGLLIGGVPASRIARRHGTPLYVYSEEAIVDRMREYSTSLSLVYPDSAVAYAGKAYLTMRMASLVAREGLWLDVASGGELYVALQAGFPPERVIFHGNNKSQDELTMAVQAGVGRVVVDNLDELAGLQKTAKEQGRVQDILLRLTPGIDPHTHKYLATGEIDSKFGIAMHGDRHFAAARAASRSPNLNLLGFHCHVGSQVFDTSVFVATARAMMNFALALRDRDGIAARELDLGGGLGVVYAEGPGEGELRHGDACGTTTEEMEVPPRRYLAEMALEVKRLGQEKAFPLPRLYVEPGRSIVAAAGVTLYTVGSVKELPDGVTVAAVDGGMSDNPRPMLYGTRYRAVTVQPPRETGVRRVRIVGKHCEEGDTLIQEAYLPPLRPGDLLAVLVSGAYQHSMRSSYNALPAPAVVHVARQRAFTVVERQTYRDLVAKERPVRDAGDRRQDKTANGI